MNDSLLEKANKAVEEFLDTDPRKCEPGEYGRIHQKANVGLRIRDDQFVNLRVDVDQKLRAIGLAFADPVVREGYARSALLKFLPDLQSKPEKS